MENDTSEFEDGRFVRLTKEGIKSKSTPALLHKIGWPNRFLISAVHVTENETLLELDPCCAWMEEPTDRTKVTCKAHPAKFFELLPGHIREEVEAAEKAESEPTPEPEPEAEEPPAETVKIPKELTADNPDVQSFEFQGISIRINKKARAIMLQKEDSIPVIVRGAFAQKMMGYVDQLGMLVGL